MSFTRLTQEQIQEEQQLVEAAQQNPRRFSVLYNRYYEAMFLFVFKRVREEEVAADLVSELFLKAMKNLNKYRFQGKPFSAWLYRIAVNEVNQFFRQSQKQRHVSIDSADLASLMEEADERYYEPNLQLLTETLQQLAPEELQFLELRYFEKIPFRELAEVYQISENNAKVRMHRLLKKLKTILEQSRQETIG